MEMRYTNGTVLPKGYGGGCGKEKPAQNSSQEKNRVFSSNPGMKKLENGF
jgi:hypothetical protein